MGAVKSKTMTDAALTANRQNARKPRRLRLTGELITAMATAIRAGVRPEIAALMNGVPRRTYFEWMEKARRPDARPLLVDLLEQVEMALAEWEAADVLQIGQAARKAGDGEWQAAAWRLERRLPSVYGRRTQQEVTVQARPFIDLSKLSLDEQRMLRDLLIKGAPDQEELPKDGAPAMLALTAGDPEPES